MIFLEAFPGLTLGLKESLNPCTVTAVLIFWILLTSRCRTKFQVLIVGTFFLLSSFLTHFCLVFGAFDKFLSLSYINEIISYFYLALGGGFLVWGFLHLTEWWKYKRGGSETSWVGYYPSFLRPQEGSDEKKWFVFVKYGLMSSILGFVTVLFSIVWPQNYYLFVMYYSVMSGTNILVGFLSILLYSFGIVVPMLIFWLAIIYMINLPRISDWMKRNLSFLKIVTSAIYLSCGWGLIFVFLNRS